MMQGGLDEDEERELRALSEAVAEARNQPWQPRVVADAFASAGAGERRLTMQGWIDLDRERSPLLRGGNPHSLEELEAGYRAFGLRWEGVEKVTPEKTVEEVAEMKAAIAAAFEMIMPMTRPDGQMPGKNDTGMGSWLPIMACLIVEMRLGPAEAMALPVGQAFALIAAMRANQGWKPRGESYAEREVVEKI